MSLSALTGSARLSDRLNPSKIRELASVILKSEHPHLSRAVIDPLLELLVGSQFDLKENFLVKEPNVVLLLLELLANLTEDLQLELWSTLTAILHRSLWNIHVCRQLHLIERCLDYLRKTESGRVANHVAMVIEILGGYTLTVKELKAIISYLYAGQTKTWAPHSIALIGALNNMSMALQPDVFFNFSGQQGAALTLPPISKWPTQSGFTFTTWIRVEKPYDSQRDYYKPVVYWFRTGKGLGYSAHFIGHTLVLETVGKGHKKPQTHAVEYVFHSYQWYMVSVVYSRYRLKSNEVCCYVNGLPVLTVEVSLPNTEDVYDKCFLGSSPSASPDTIFQGQMSAVYLFREPLSKEIIAALNKLGPGYKSQFKFDAESDVPLTTQEKKILFDGHLSSLVIVSYNAKAVDGQLCLEASPNEKQSCFVHSPHATLLEGVEPVITTSFHSTLHSLGGVQALFPLFSQLDLPQASGGVDYTLSVKLLSLVFELTRNSTSFMLQLVQMKAIGLIGYLLEKVSPIHLCPELVSCIFDFARYLSETPNGCELLLQFLECLIFNAGLWSKAEQRVQTQLYSRLATEFSLKPLGTTGLDLRECVGVSQLFFILREYYSLAGENVPVEKHAEVRRYILLIVKQLVTKDKGIQNSELQCILHYLCTIPEEENLHDVLNLLLALVFEDASQNSVKIFEELEGLNIATKLLACSSEELTLNALQLIGKVLHHSTTRHRKLLIESVGLFVVIREKLLSAGQPVSIAMFNTLFEVLVDCPSRSIIGSHYLALDLSHQIEFPGMLAVMVELVCTLHTAAFDWEETDTLMRMQLFSYISSLCAQNSRNCRAVLQLHHWQHWLLMLADQEGSSESDQNHLQEMVFKLFHTLLLYCFQHEQDGWRVWIETAAALQADLVIKGSTGGSVLMLPSDLSLEGLSTSSFTDLHSSSASSVELIREELTVDADTESHDRTDLGESSLNVTGSGGDGSSPTQRVEAQAQESNLDDSPSNDKPNDSAEEKTSSLSGDPATPTTSSQKSKSLKPAPLTLITTTATTPPSITRTPSVETPSPFFIPRNPFLSVVGKMPKFRWSSGHLRLLEDLLKSLTSIVNKWKRGNLSKHLGNDSNQFLRSNMAHLLALTTDSIIGLNGGLKHLLAKSTNPQLAELKLSDSLESSQASSLRAAIATDPERPQSLLWLCHELAEVIVLSGLLKLSPVEARTKMESGGMIKQGLRLVLSVASLACTQVNSECKDLHRHYHREKLSAEQLHRESIALLRSLGLGESALQKYFHSSLEKRIEHLQSCQCLLTEDHLAYLHSIIPKEGESKQVVQQLVIAIIYCLSVMSVARYRAILLAADKEDSMSLDSTDSGSTAAESQSTQPVVELHSLKTANVKSSSVEGTPESLSFVSGIEQSLLPSAYVPTTDVSEQVEVTLKLVVTFLCQLLVEHKALLSKVFVGSDGRQLLTDAVLRLAEKRSIIEMTMLLASREWQASLQRIGGKTFSDVLSEGRHVAHFGESYMRSVASKSTANFRQSVETQTQKFTDFEEQLSLFVSQTIRTSIEDAQLRMAEVKRHFFSAKELWRKVSFVVDEHGSFDFTPLRPCQFWRLDLREDALRQRLKLLPNPHGTLHEEASRKEDTGPEVKGKEDAMSAVVSPKVASDVMFGGEDISLASEEITESLVAAEFSIDQEQASQLLSIKCHMVVLAYAVPGTLVFTKSCFSFTADDSSEEYNHANQLSEYCSINEKWLLSNVRAVFSRWYIHQHKALEIFFANRTSVYLVFENFKEVKTVVRNLPKVGVGSEYDLPQTRSTSLASPQQLFRKSSMTTRWERREISNFEYLMFLNTISGRSYNDLNQYPVFPWILKDYTSKTLDLNDSDVYRDLSKPVGALSPARLQQFEERYNSWEDDNVPPFLYGTHYSTMAFVLHWLVRVEPYSSLHIRFHDGMFDHGSRLFSSLEHSWEVSLEDTSDVKELIPEFFYLPELFLNVNKFDLGHDGACEEGDPISDVSLPPWASSAHDFIQKHKEALESEYVSANLHQWIDLIFGHKQRGEEAVKAKNVFYYLTYTGTVDLDSVSDPQLRKGFESQICHFGQTPAQLLKEPHPSRQPLIKGFPPQPVQGLNPRDQALVAELQVTPDVPIGLVQLSSNSPSVLAVPYNQLYAVNKWSVTAGTLSQPPLVSLEPDPQIAVGLRTRLGDPLDQSISASAACFAALPSNEVILVCGFWDNSFKCFAADTGVVVQTVFGHRDIVTCIDFSPECGLHGNPGNGLIASGSHDATVLLWRWSGRWNRVVPETQVDSVTPLAVLTGHEQSIVCVSLSAIQDLVVSGAKCKLASSPGCVKERKMSFSLSRGLGMSLSHWKLELELTFPYAPLPTSSTADGCCLVHSTCGELLHKLIPTSQWTHPHMISLTRHGLTVVHYADQKGCLATFTCNGKQLCQCLLEDPALALVVSGDGRHVIAGGFNCSVRVFLAETLELKYAYEPFESSIRSLYISEDQSITTLVTVVLEVIIMQWNVVMQEIYQFHGHWEGLFGFIFTGLASGNIAVLATHFWIH